MPRRLAIVDGVFGPHLKSVDCISDPSGKKFFIFTDCYVKFFSGAEGSQTVTFRVTPIQSGVGFSDSVEIVNTRFIEGKHALLPRGRYWKESLKVLSVVRPKGRSVNNCCMVILELREDVG